MKLALLGDIHGNARALEAVLVAAKISGVGQLLITGDLVGYYFEPLKVLDMLAPWEKHIVRGNHEDMLHIARSEPDKLDEFDARYGTGLRVTLEQLDESRLNVLCDLPHPMQLEIDNRKIMLCHGSPWDLEQYIYPDAASELLEMCASPGFDLVVMGHTHYPMHYQIGHTLLVNPGSVGQPRNRQPGAHWVLYDTDSGRIELRNEQYDVGSLVEECRRRLPALPYLSEVLLRT